MGKDVPRFSGPGIPSSFFVMQRYQLGEHDCDGWHVPQFDRLRRTRCLVSGLMYEGARC